MDSTNKQEYDKITSTNELDLSLYTYIYDRYNLTEKDFYPPEDTRLYQSGIDDIYDGDNFAEYVESFWDMYEDEIYDN